MAPLAQRICARFFRSALAPVAGLEHLPRRGGYVIAANHVDFLDGFFINAAVMHSGTEVRLRFISKTNNYWWLKGHMLPLAHEVRGQVFALASHALGQGDIIVNFPEGHRNSERFLAPGHRGTARMALATGCAIVPCGLIEPAGLSFLGSFMKSQFQKAYVRVSFGPPIPVTQNQSPSPENISQLTDQIMRAIALLADKQPPQVVR